MKTRKGFNGLLLFAFIFMTSLALAGCAGQQAKPEASAEPVAADPPLDKAYNVILIDKVQCPDTVEKDYREAINQIQQAAIWSLQDKKTYQSVDRYQANQTAPQDALIVKVTVPEMRLVSGAARIWGGAFAGSSFINMDIDFIDAATNAVVRKKELSSSNNAFAASWTGGSSDQSLPSDMGKILAEYIHAIIPK